MTGQILIIDDGDDIRRGLDVRLQASHQAAIEAGAVHYFQKPADDEDSLLVAISSALR